MKTVALISLILLTGCFEVQQKPEAKSEVPSAPSVRVTEEVIAKTATVISGTNSSIHLVSVDSTWSSYMVMGDNFNATIDPQTGAYQERDLRFSDENCSQDPVGVGNGVRGLVFANRGASVYYRVDSRDKKTIVAKSKLTTSGCEQIPQTKSVQVAVVHEETTFNVDRQEYVTSNVTEYHTENQNVDTTYIGLSLTEVSRPYDFTAIAPLEISF